MKKKESLNSMAAHFGIAEDELETWRNEYLRDNKIIPVIRSILNKYQSDEHFTRLILMFSFGFTPRDLVAIFAWRNEPKSHEDEWVEGVLQDHANNFMK